ncbi:hypothetical protein [Vallitalea okinawensis]|uniref:hypothetical protein n=1 Tax=Vallitalea okinawensis TaxID=2078660 RepID=UPI000CFBD569|nr:hypothetical protein [Vallitalea okinawensis]
MHSKIYHLEGLQYKDSTNEVRKSLECLNGVKQVSFSTEKTMQIDYEWPATDTEIEQTISQNGFTTL